MLVIKILPLVYERIVLHFLDHVENQVVYATIHLFQFSEKGFSNII